MPDKLKKLVNNLKIYKSLAVCFSGGVDSSFLAAVAKDACNRAVAITVKSEFQSGKEAGNAVHMAQVIGIDHVIVNAGLLADSGIAQNTGERCYFCKKTIFSLARAKAFELGLGTVVHGANIDDLADFRPGFKASRELGIIAPLIDAGLSKNEIRDLSRSLGLETWNMEAQSCLATRIPYGETITLKKLAMVENAENVLYLLGITEARVRCHGEVARIELGQARGPGGGMDQIMEKKLRNTVVKELKKIGFKYIALDLEGYVMGSMNRSLG